eukprot:5540597-Lingulodinium_polyedra.AAC.1
MGATHCRQLKTLEVAAVSSIVLLRETAAGVTEGAGSAHLSGEAPGGPRPVQDCAAEQCVVQ